MAFGLRILLFDLSFVLELNWYFVDFFLQSRQAEGNTYAEIQNEGFL